MYSRKVAVVVNGLSFADVGSVGNESRYAPAKSAVSASLNEFNVLMDTQTAVRSRLRTQEGNAESIPVRQNLKA